MQVNTSVNLLKIALCYGMISGTFCTQYMDYESIWSLNDEIENVVYNWIPPKNIPEPTLEDVKELHSRAKKVLKYYKKYKADEQTQFYVNELKELFPLLKTEYNKMMKSNEV